VCNNGVPGDDDETILAVRSESWILGTMGDDTGDVDGEYDGEGVSRVTSRVLGW
jgi:hypothetical protein